MKENRVLPIDQQLGSIRATLVKKNHLKLRSIAATVILCGHQALALRSHLDHGPVMIEDDSVNRVDFQALLRFRVDAGDQVLKEHLETASLNATYTSKEIQNQVISICGDIIQNRLLDKIHKAKFFSVIADQATDSSNVEQLSINVCFLENSEPQEKFLGFQECIFGTTGEAIADNILSKLTDWKFEAEHSAGRKEEKIERNVPN